MSALSMLTITFSDHELLVVDQFPVVEQFSVKGCGLGERDAIVSEFLRLLRARGLHIIRIENLKDEGI